MSKVALRLIVVILIVVLAVFITTSILHKPNYSSMVYNLYVESTTSQQFDLGSKINRTISSISPDFNGRSLIDCEQNVKEIYYISLGLDAQIEYLSQLSKYSSNVSEQDGEELNKLMKNYISLRISRNGTAYWIDSYYSYVQDKNFSISTESEMRAYNQLVECICLKWKEQSASAVALYNALKGFVSKYCFNDLYVSDLKSVLLDAQATFSSLFINASSQSSSTGVSQYENFVNNHYTAYMALRNAIANKLSATPLSYSDDDRILSNNYFFISQDTINSFLSSNNRQNIIDQQENMYIQSALIALNEYLG